MRVLRHVDIVIDAGNIHLYVALAQPELKLDRRLRTTKKYTCIYNKREVKTISAQPSVLRTARADYASERFTYWCTPTAVMTFLVATKIDLIHSVTRLHL